MIDVVGNGVENSLGFFPNLWLGATVCNQEEADRDIPKLLNTTAAVRFLSIEPLLSEVNLPMQMWEISVQGYGTFHHYGNENTAESARANKANWEQSPAIKRLFTAVDWVIVGGESGKDARPMHPQWVRSLRDQCAAARVPFFFKQWGEWQPCDALDWDGKSPKIVMRDDNTAYIAHGKDLPLIIIDTSTPDHAFMQRVGKKNAGRVLDHKTHDEYPVRRGLNND